MQPTDTNLTPWISLGLGGVLAVGIYYLVWHLLTKAIPEMVDAFLVELGKARQEYLTSINGIETKFVAALDRHGDRAERIHEKVVLELAQLKDSMKSHPGD